MLLGCDYEVMQLC